MQLTELRHDGTRKRSHLAATCTSTTTNIITIITTAACTICTTASSSTFFNPAIAIASIAIAIAVAMLHEFGRHPEQAKVPSGVSGDARAVTATLLDERQQVSEDLLEVGDLKLR